MFRKNTTGTKAETNTGSAQHPKERIYINKYALAVGTTLVSVLPSVIANYGAVKDVVDDLNAVFTKSLESSAIEEISPSFYVPRKGIEAKIHSWMDDEATVIYAIIYGMKGVGKSSLMDHLFSKRKGVVKVNITDVSTRGEVVNEIVKKILGPKYTSEFTVDDLVAAIKNCKITPTIIFDVERGDNISRGENVTKPLRSIAKLLVETEKCKVFIVLSEANAITDFGGDDSREKYFLVNEMTEEEAKELLKKRKFLCTDANMEYVFKKIGTNSSMLRKLINEVPKECTVQQFVERKLKKAKKQLRDFKYQAILEALKKNPEGVDTELVGEMLYYGLKLDSIVVAAEMKRVNAVLYDMDEMRYKLMSQAHKTAIQTYVPGKDPRI